MSNEGNAATCPFCGGHDVMVGRDVMTQKWWMVCFSCGMEIKDNLEEIKKEDKK